MDEWLSELNKHVREALPAELPSLIGALEQLKALMLVRLTQPVGSFVPQKDYTAGELAAHLKAPKGTVYRLYRDGVWPHAFKVGRMKGLRIPSSDVEAWRTNRNDGPRFEVISSSKRPR